METHIIKAAGKSFYIDDNGKFCEMAKEEKETAEAEQQEKMGYEETVHDPVMGATSFAELDVIEDAHQRHGKLRKIIDAFSAIANNIFYDSGLDPTERPALIRNATEEMRARLDSDFETGRRQVKAAMKTEGGIEYRASDFADVSDSETPSTWKLRLAEGRSGNFTVAQVARAITALQPSGFRGNKVELGQPRATVISKISAAIGKTDGTAEQKENLRERLNAVKSLIAQHTGFKVLETKEGGYRWLGWVSNKYIDREGEILTDKAHNDFVAWLDENPTAAPELWTYHIPGTGRKSKADFWAYLNGFLLLGGKLTESEAKAINNYEGDLGMSHGFYVLEKQDNLINKYRTFEATVLPYKAAANLWTKFNVKEMADMANSLSEEQRELAVQLHGEDFVTALEGDTQKMATALNEAGIQSKSETVEEVEEKQGEKSQALNPVLLAEIVAKAVTEQLNPKGLQDAIKAIHEQGAVNATAIENIVKRLEQLEKSDDEKMAKELSPRIPAGIDWMGGFRASQSEKTVIKEDEKETFEKAKPNESWVTQAFGFGGQ